MDDELKQKAFETLDEQVEERFGNQAECILNKAAGIFGLKKSEDAKSNEDSSADSNKNTSDDDDDSSNKQDEEKDDSEDCDDDK